ncbi:MAG: alpha/beta fold hydrolase [Saprospiraceae bacterium]
MHKIALKALGLGLNLWSIVAPQHAATTTTKIFSKPPKTRLRPKERQFLSTARQVRRKLAGQNIVEYHWGKESAALVLLSYGWAYNAGRWRHFVPVLVDAGFRVLAYDPPGHGLAPSGTMNIPANAAIIRALLKDYGPVSTMVGHSFGGGSSIYALKDLPASMHPSRMVVMASFSFAPRIFLEYKKALGLWSPLYWRMVRGFEERIGHSIDHFDFALMAADFPHINALLVHDPADPVTPYSESRRYHDFWPGSHLYGPKEGGHHLGTAGITRAVLEFLLEGAVPQQAERQEQPLVTKHELLQHFAGL